MECLRARARTCGGLQWQSLSTSWDQCLPYIAHTGRRRHPERGGRTIWGCVGNPPELHVWRHSFTNLDPTAHAYISRTFLHNKYQREKIIKKSEIIVAPGCLLSWRHAYFLYTGGDEKWPPARHQVLSGPWQSYCGYYYLLTFVTAMYLAKVQKISSVQHFENELWRDYANYRPKLYNLAGISVKINDHLRRRVNNINLLSQFKDMSCGTCCTLHQISASIPKL